MRFVPWFTDDSVKAVSILINLIKLRDKRQPRIFEFGSGSSTLYFLSLGCIVHSVEHDTDWAHKVISVSEVLGLKKRLRLSVSPAPYWEIYGGEDSYFDIVVIDGKDRNECIQTVLNNKMPEILILDNSSRPSYSISVAAIREFYEVHNFEQEWDGNKRSTMVDLLGKSLKEPWSTSIGILKNSKDLIAFSLSISQLPRN